MIVSIVLIGRSLRLVTTVICHEIRTGCLWDCQIGDQDKMIGVPGTMSGDNRTI